MKSYVWARCTRSVSPPDAFQYIRDESGEEYRCGTSTEALALLPRVRAQVQKFNSSDQTIYLLKETSEVVSEYPVKEECRCQG
jgi:hypothetical protein